MFHPRSKNRSVLEREGENGPWSEYKTQGTSAEGPGDAAKWPCKTLLTKYCDDATACLLCMLGIPLLSYQHSEWPKLIPVRSYTVMFVLKTFCKGDKGPAGICEEVAEMLHQSTC